MLSEAFVNGLSAGSKQLTGLSSLPESSDDSELLERALKAEEEIRLLKVSDFIFMGGMRCEKVV